MKTNLESPCHQFNFYDQESGANESVDQAKQWFARKLQVPNLGPGARAGD